MSDKEEKEGSKEGSRRASTDYGSDGEPHSRKGSDASAGEEKQEEQQEEKKSADRNSPEPQGVSDAELVSGYIPLFRIYFQFEELISFPFSFLGLRINFVVKKRRK